MVPMAAGWYSHNAIIIQKQTLEPLQQREAIQLANIIV
jgi:hypothetical protein